MSGPAQPGDDPRFLGLGPGDSDPATARIVILPVPHERTSTFGRGSAAGPAAVIAASREVELFDAVLGREPWRELGGIATLPPLGTAAGGPAGADLAAALAAEVGRLLDDGRFVVTLGGEHSSTVGAVRAHADRFPDLSVLQLDAHSDLRPSYLDDPWNHACAMARVLDFHDHLTAVGIRSQAAEERALIAERGIVTVYAHEIPAGEGRGWLDRVLAALRPRVYVTLDCDVLDPAVMPATGTPEPDGLSFRQLDALLARLCAEREVVGLDVSELAPVAGLHHAEFTVAKLIYRFLGRRFGGATAAPGPA